MEVAGPTAAGDSHVKHMDLVTKEKGEQKIQNCVWTDSP